MNRKGDIYGYEEHHDPYRPASDRDEELWYTMYDLASSLDDANLIEQYTLACRVMGIEPTLDISIPDDREMMVEQVAFGCCLADYLQRRARWASKRKASVVPLAWQLADGRLKRVPEPQPGEIGYRHPFPPSQIEWDGDH